MIINLRCLRYIFSNGSASPALAISIFPMITIFKDYSLFSSQPTSENRYWTRQSIREVIQDGDNLFLNEKYLEAYELLNRLKFHDNPEIQWRICRVLFKMSFDETVSRNVKAEMINEAYGIISMALTVGSDNALVHKWMAIILNAKTGLESTVSRVKSLATVKAHLEKAIELDPNDFAVLHMLGKCCFDLSNFTWIQRFISSVFFASPPLSTYEEAYKYFLLAEELKPRFYLPNLYMLGRTSYLMNQYFRARYYLKLVENLAPQSEFEKKCATQAKDLAVRLQPFDVAQCALLADIYSGNV